MKNRNGCLFCTCGSSCASQHNILLSAWLNARNLQKCLWILKASHISPERLLVQIFILWKDNSHYLLFSCFKRLALRLGHYFALVSAVTTPGSCRWFLKVHSHSVVFVVALLPLTGRKKPYQQKAEVKYLRNQWTECDYSDHLADT